MLYIGIDVGGSSIKGGLVNEDGTLLYKTSKPIADKKDADSLVQLMVELCNNILDYTETDISDIIWIGCGIPGPCDKKQGIIISTTNLGFENFNLSEALKEHFDTQIFIGNDASCAALGECTSGATKNTSSSVILTLGTGIGAGIILNNLIYSGFNDIAGELGHTVIKVGGKQCNCGKRGCFETYASASALVEMTQELAKDGNAKILELCNNNIDDIDGRTIFEAVRQGDAGAKTTLDEYIEYLGTGVVNIINTFQPEMLVIGGGLSNEGDDLLNPLREYVMKNEFCSKVCRTKIVRAKLGNDAGIIGAAMLGMR